MALVVVAMVVEVIVKPNLASTEHLVAIGTALVLCAPAVLRLRHPSDGDGGAGGPAVPPAGD
ncbi:hypothetical protein ACH4CE_33560 [Streptomyces gelaticus]|uniref:hypothetical protein n=1 Tax=Streptomyces gelaticus TaxID=285446 RepID=UPI0037BAEFA9